MSCKMSMTYNDCFFIFPTLSRCQGPRIHSVGWVSRRSHQGLSDSRSARPSMPLAAASLFSLIFSTDIFLFSIILYYHSSLSLSLSFVMFGFSCCHFFDMFARVLLLLGHVSAPVLVQVLRILSALPSTPGMCHFITSNHKQSISVLQILSRPSSQSTP